MKLRPLDDRIVIKQSQAEEKTSGGIILPDTAKEKPQQGKVIAVGKGKIEKDGIVAMVVSIPLAAAESLEDWVKALEEPPQGRTSPVWYAARVMKTDFEVAKRASTI